jgi:hypothetical protein
VRELACTSGLECKAGGNLTAGRVTHARQVLREEPGKERYSGRGGCGLKMGQSSVEDEESNTTWCHIQEDHDVY